MKEYILKKIFERRKVMSNVSIMKLGSFFKIVLMGCMYLLLMICLVGCARQIIRSERLPAKTEQISNKNYVIGQVYTSFVGQKVVNYKDYYLTSTTEDVMRPDKSFKIQSAMSPWFNARASEEYPIRGEIEYEGNRYKVVDIRDRGIGVLVETDGKLYPKIISGTNILVAGTVEPPIIYFTQGKKTIVDSKKGFINYELIYGGTDGRSFVLTYREYTPDDLIKAGFTQNVTYKNDLSAIRYRNLKINVLEVTNEYIKYKVLSDE